MVKKLMRGIQPLLGGYNYSCTFKEMDAFYICMSQGIITAITQQVTSLIMTVHENGPACNPMLPQRVSVCCY